MYVLVCISISMPRIDSVHANILGIDSGYAIYSWNRQCACYVFLG